MGEAKRRGTFDERKAQAVTVQRIPKMSQARPAGEVYLPERQETHREILPDGNVRMRQRTVARRYLPAMSLALAALSMRARDA